MNGPSNDNEARRLLLSDIMDEIEIALAWIFATYSNPVSEKIKKKYRRLQPADWDEIWSYVLWDLYRMKKKGQIRDTGELEGLLYRLARNRGWNCVRSILRHLFVRAGLPMDCKDPKEDSHGMFHLLDGIDAYALTLSHRERLVLATAAELMQRLGIKKLRQLPLLTVIGIVNATAKPHVSLEEADEILKRVWRYLYAFLRREGYGE